MKTLKYILPILVVALFFGACYNDEGNYDYLTSDEVSIIKIDTTNMTVAERYVFNYSLSPGDNVKFAPEVNYKYPEHLRYRWFYLTLNNGVYAPEQQGNQMVYPPADTIATTKDLDWVVNLAPGYYRFYLMAEDSINGQKTYYQTAQYTTVSAESNQGGLYMLSEYDGQTDIDIVCSSLQLISGSGEYPRYYSQQTGNMIAGKPKFICGTHSGSTNKNAYMVCTDQTMLRLNAVGLVTMDKWDDMFYNAPTSYDVQNDYFVNNCEFLINEGKLYTLYTNKSNDRKMSAPIAGDYEADNYLAHATKTSYGAVTGAISADQVIYDKKNHKFRPYFAYDTTIGSFKSTSGSANLDANHLPNDPVAFMNGYGEWTYCIVPEETGHYLYLFNFFNRVDEGDLSAYGANSRISLAGCKEISNAKYYTANTKGYAFYYATDKTVYSFSPSTGQTTSNTIYECEPNETVTCIYTWNGGGWPTEGVIFWVAVWDSNKNEGKLLEYEVDNNSGLPRSFWGPMFGGDGTNPVITTGWGKIKSMMHISAE